MASGDLFDFEDNSLSMPKVNLLTMFRLGLFQMGLGIMSVLTLGVLNRVMIDPKLLGVPATIAAGTTAMALFVSPGRVWFGQMSDSKKLWGYHRTGYIWAGLSVLALFVFLAVQVVWQLGGSLSNGWTLQSTAWAALLALVFALYGLCIDASSTTYAALLVDVSDEDNRSKLVGVVWSLLMVGIVVGAVISKKLLEGLTRETLQGSVNRLFIILPITVVCLGFIATIGIEKKYSRFASRSILADRENRITLSKALKVLTASRQTALFFSFLLVMTISLFLQQPILEPFGGEVFHMTVAQGALLNACWGIGVLVGMSVTGFLIVPRLGKQKTARLGCWAVAVSFGLVIATGFTGNSVLLKSAVLVLGLAGGVLTNGAVSLMLDLTSAEAAGTFLGAWGLAQALAQGLATVGGGGLLDLGRRLLNTPVLAYSLVFATSALGMIFAVSLLNSVNTTEFQSSIRRAIASRER
ncbi:MAG: BCD family MFS transporter [Rhizonema sp. PD37]|nr:BCD family MFS transporter [Rhizonema sp. PD37]